MKNEKLFEKYGQTAIFTSGGTSVHFSAFIQPLRYKNKLYLRGKYTEIGKNREDYYLYIGPPEVDISVVDGDSKTLTVDGVSYLAYRVEKHSVSGKAVYVWAIIRPVISDDGEDGTQGGEEAVG